MTLADALRNIRNCGLDTRTAEVLIALGAEPACATDLSQRTGLNRSTVHHCLSALEATEQIGRRTDVEHEFAGAVLYVFFLTSAGTRTLLTIYEPPCPS